MMLMEAKVVTKEIKARIKEIRARVKTKVVNCRVLMSETPESADSETSAVTAMTPKTQAGQRQVL